MVKVWMVTPGWKSGNFFSCVVAIRQVIYMQFIALQMTCRIVVTGHTLTRRDL